MTQHTAGEISDAYDKIDRHLRNSLDDTDYAAFSEALDTIHQPAAPMLLAELQNIANANILNWDAPHNDTATFHQWAQSRARAAIAAATGEQA